jgi:hypothetical protein
MRADTQFSVVEATLKGYNKWVAAHGQMPQQDVNQFSVFSLLPATDVYAGATTERIGEYIGNLGYESYGKKFRGMPLSYLISKKRGA